MYLIVGLGNPESDYSKTRHNMGFNVINKLSEKYDIEVNKSKFKGLIGNGLINGEKVILLKPQTFMNLSGESVIEAMNFYKISEDELIVHISDEVLESLNKGAEIAVDAISEIMKNNIDSAMNKFNKKKDV